MVSRVDHDTAWKHSRHFDSYSERMVSDLVRPHEMERTCYTCDDEAHDGGLRDDLHEQQSYENKEHRLVALVHGVYPLDENDWMGRDLVACFAGDAKDLTADGKMNRNASIASPFHKDGAAEAMQAMSSTPKTGQRAARGKYVQLKPKTF